MTKRCATLVLMLVCGVMNCAAAVNKQIGQSPATRLKDLVFWISFSPDGRMLAIARGGGDSSQEFARVELWNAETGELLRAIKGFDGRVWSVSFSPDGKTLVTGSSEYRSESIREKGRRKRNFVELKWWDAQTGELKHKIGIPDENTVKVIAAYSPDGKLLATLEQTSNMPTIGPPPFNVPSILAITPESKLKLLDAQTGNLKLKLEGSFKTDARWVSTDVQFDRLQREAIIGGVFARPSHLLFSPNGEFLAARSPSEIRVWNTRTGSQVSTVKNFKGRLSAIVFSPDGRWLAAGVNSFENENKSNSRSEIRLYEVSGGKLARTLQLRTDVISSLAFAPNGKQMLIGGLNRSREFFGGVELLHLENGSVGTLRTGGDLTVRSVALSPDGRKLVLQVGALSVKMLSTDTWKMEHAFDAGSADDVNRRSASRFVLTVKSVMSVTFSPDGKTLWGDIEGAGIKQWDVRTGEVGRYHNGEDAPSIVAFALDGKSVAEVGEDEKVRFWDGASAKRTLVPTSGEPVSTIALSDDGGLLAIASDHELTIRNTKTGQTVSPSFTHTATISCVTISSDGSTLASADDQGIVKLWDLSKGKIKITVAVGAKVTSLRFSPNSQMLASAIEGGTISVWDARTGTQRLKLKKHEATVNALAFSSDGQWLASGGDDRAVIIWEMGSGKSKRSLKGHDVTVASLAFSPDGSLIASGSGNASVVLWDVATGKLNRVLR